MIIGLTGTFGAGKGAVADILKKKGFVQLVMSDILREECKKERIEETRDNLLSMGNKLRTKFGFGILVKKLVEKSQKENHKNVIIDGLRSLGEVEELKKNKGILIAVDAPLKTRYERVIKRGTSKDNITFEEFKKQEENEYQIKDCVKNANYTIINNSTMEELNKKIQETLNKLE